MKDFPNNEKAYLQNNRTNVFPLGNLWSTFNIDLESNLGAVRISPRLKIVTSATDDADLGVPVAFKAFDTKIFAICGSKIFAGGPEPDDAFIEDASTGVQTDYAADESDMEIFNNELCTTTTDALYSKAANGSGAGAWTSRDTLNVGSPHIVCYFRKFNRLYYTNQERNIISINTSWVTADPGADYALQLNSNVDFISCMRSTSDFIWIGTINREEPGGLGSVYNWDGISAQPSKPFKFEAQGALAMCILNDVPYIMDSNGILRQYTGYAFEEVARLPFGIKLPYNISDTDNERFIHPNGMFATKNGTIRMAINNRANTGNVIENLPSGIWEWSKDTGLKHIQSFSYNPVGSSTITDFGQNRISRIGALASMVVPTTSNSDGTMLIGAVVFTDASSSLAAIFTDNSKDDVQKKGYYVSDFWEAEEVQDEWENLWSSFRKFLDSNDRIVAKYRFYEASPTYFDLTWVNTTSFTTSTDLSSYGPTATGYDGTYGGEIEIIRGTGGGSIAHITNITGSGPYTVTIDTTITGVTTGTASARAQAWIKLLPEITPTLEPNVVGATWAKLAISSPESRIQVKIGATFTGAGEIYRHKITSKGTIDIE